MFESDMGVLDTALKLDTAAAVLSKVVESLRDPEPAGGWRVRKGVHRVENGVWASWARDTDHGADLLWLRVDLADSDSWAVSVVAASQGHEDQGSVEVPLAGFDRLPACHREALVRELERAGTVVRLVLTVPGLFDCLYGAAA